MSTYYPIDGGIASCPDELDPDRPVAGEIPPGVVPLPTSIVSLWCVCFCTDDTHPEREFAQRQTWGDGQYVFTPAWHLNRADAVTDYNYAAGQRHIVHRSAHVVVRPDAVEVA